jgi:hypothetical protein
MSWTGRRWEATTTAVSPDTGSSMILWRRRCRSTPNIVSRDSWGMGVLGSILVEIEADSGEVGFATGAGGDAACYLTERHFRRFVVGSEPKAREKAGPDHLLMIDCYLSFDVPYAIALADAVAELPLFGTLFDGEMLPQNGLIEVSEEPGWGLRLRHGSVELRRPFTVDTLSLQTQS